MLRDSSSNVVSLAGWRGSGAGATAETSYEEREAERERSRLAEPEPEDKTTAEWRHWKLAHLYADFESGDAERVARAWGEFWLLFDGFRSDTPRQTVSAARALLPHLITAAQDPLCTNAPARSKMRLPAAVREAVHDAAREATSPAPHPGVPDLNLWRQSRPRPLR